VLTAKNESFYFEGEPFQILSGGMHYFRTVPEHWEDRLLKLKALGLNTVETYIPWNFHEPKKGQFNFSGMADIERFIELAHTVGLYVILRPAPYICAEWEMGGLPSWLMKHKSLVMRSSHPSFLKHVEDYFAELLPKFKKHLYQNGGPVIAMQIENEYGAYGNDLAYLDFYKEQYKKHELETFLFTSDGPDFIKQGSLPDVTTTLNFGSRVDESFDALEAFKPGSPKMVAEFWIGWFDYWTGEHTVRSGEDVAAVFKEIMEKNISVNFYMFHGGTNFGFMNGANHYDIYYPTITSYDYDSLLTEGGAITEKYKAVKKVLGEYREVPADFEETPSAKAYGDGYTLYRTTVNRQGELKLNSGNIRDRGFIYINGIYITTTYINDTDKELTLEFPDSVNTLEILVENMGRANYGEHLTDPKGLIKNLWLGEQYFFHWEMFKIEMDRLPEAYELSGEERFPKFFRGSFDADEGMDTYVDTQGFTKGNVFINGFNLGRYWNAAGPQQRLYLPGPLLKKENNEIVVLELENTTTDQIQLLDQPKLS